MTTSPVPHSDGAVRVTNESHDSPEPHKAVPDTSSFNLEIEAPVGKLKLSAQGRATIAVVVAFVVTGALVGIGGSVFLNHNQANQPTIESYK